MDILKRVQRIFLAPFDQVNFFAVNLENIHQKEIIEAASLLGQEDLVYSMRFKFQKDRYRSILSHAILRYHLGQFLDREPWKIQFCRSEHGKPYIENYPIHFNLSHTQHYAFFALTFANPIGIDIEFVKSDEGIIPLSKEFMSDSEREFVASASDSERWCFRFWCAKEALLKAQGTGFLIDKIPVLTGIKELSSVCRIFICDHLNIYVYDDVLKEHKVAVCLLP